MRVTDIYLGLLFGVGSNALPSASGHTLSVSAVWNKNYKPNGYQALERAYARYGRPESMARKSGDGKNTRRQNQQGSEPNNPYPDYDREYLAEVSIGSPAQKLLLDFDTGSSDLWVFSSELSASQSKGHTLYNPGQSSSAEHLRGESWNITYVDESGSSGDVYSDIVTIGGLNVQDQAVETATWVSEQFTNDTVNSGLVGLGFDSSNTVRPDQQRTWFSNIKSSLKAPLFTSTLRHQATGTYNFGFIDQSLYTGPLTYTPVDSSGGAWAFKSTGYSFGNAAFKNVKLNAIADTGTSVLLLPDSIAKSYWSNVKGSKLIYDDQGNPIGYVFPCSATLPSFTFGVEKSKITVPGSYINFGNAGDPDQPNTCFGGIQPGGQYTLFGDIVLKAAFVVWDDGNQRLGWAKAS